MIANRRAVTVEGVSVAPSAAYNNFSVVGYVPHSALVQSNWSRAPRTAELEAAPLSPLIRKDASFLLASCRPRWWSGAKRESALVLVASSALSTARPSGRIAGAFLGMCATHGKESHGQGKILGTALPVNGLLQPSTAGSDSHPAVAFSIAGSDSHPAVAFSIAGSALLPAA